jgi:hypothetical protein
VTEKQLHQWRKAVRENDTAALRRFTQLWLKTATKSASSRGGRDVAKEEEQDSLAADS